MKNALVAAFMFAAVPAMAHATTMTYAGPTASNIDGATQQNYSFDVSGAGVIDTLSVFVETCGTYADDLTFSLSHLGTTVTFYAGKGDTYSSVINATFSDAASAMAATSGSVTGTVKPMEALSAFKGLAVAGTYTISTIDKVVPNDGTSLAKSSITIATAAVPEPASWAMFIGGFGLVGGSLRRRQRTFVRFA